MDTIDPSTTTDTVDVETHDGSPMRAYVATPPGTDGGPWPTAIVFGELFGLTDVQRSAADRVAAMGFVAVAPDLLHRRAPGGPLPEDEAGRERGLELAGQLTREELLADVRDALAAVATHPRADPSAKPVAVGLSFGGHVAFLATATLGLPACAALYAGWLAGTDIAASRPEPTGSLTPRLAEAGSRVLMLVGEDDPMVPRADVDAVRRWADDAHAHLEIVSYPGVGHRFCSVARPGFEEAAANDAWARIAQHLRAPARSDRDAPSEA